MWRVGFVSMRNARQWHGPQNDMEIVLSLIRFHLGCAPAPKQGREERTRRLVSVYTSTNGTFASLGCRRSACHHFEIGTLAEIRKSISQKGQTLEASDDETSSEDSEEEDAETGDLRGDVERLRVFVDDLLSTYAQRRVTLVDLTARREQRWPNARLRLKKAAAVLAGAKAGARLRHVVVSPESKMRNLPVEAEPQAVPNLFFKKPAILTERSEPIVFVSMRSIRNER